MRENATSAGSKHFRKFHFRLKPKKIFFHVKFRFRFASSSCVLHQHKFLGLFIFRDFPRLVKIKSARYYQITRKHITDCVPHKDSSRVDLMTPISDTVPVTHKFNFLFFFSQFLRGSKMHRKIRMHTPTSMAVLQLNT